MLQILTQGPGFLLPASNRQCLSRWTLTLAVCVLPCSVASVCLYLHWRNVTCNIVCMLSFLVLAGNLWLNNLWHFLYFNWRFFHLVASVLLVSLKVHECVLYSWFHYPLFCYSVPQRYLVISFFNIVLLYWQCLPNVKLWQISSGRCIKHAYICTRIYMCVCAWAHVCGNTWWILKRNSPMCHKWQFNPRPILEELSQCLASAWVVIFS